MSTMLTAMKKSLPCKSNPSEVSEPKPRKKSICNFCKPKSKPLAPSNSSSISCKSALKYVIHGSKRFMQQSSTMNRSPLSIRSSDLINPVTHHVRFNKSEIKITRDLHHVNGSPWKYCRTSSAPRPRMTTLSTIPDEPGPSHTDETGPSHTDETGPSQFSGLSKHRRSVWMVESATNEHFRQACHKCGEPLARQDAEDHFLSEHAVTEVLEDDSSRKVIEMIFKVGWSNSENQGRIERILKVHNPQTKLAQFEEYREMVKIRANKLQHSKKHPRLLADGNELLRFYGTTIACSLGKKGSSNICTLQMCNVCCILRHGFGTQDGITNSVMGILTASTSEKAYRSIDIGFNEEGNHCKALKKALIVCRAIAGRVHRPVLENIQEFVSGRRSAFDSLAGNLGSDSSHVEELFVLKSTALLPCFVIVCKH